MKKILSYLNNPLFAIISLLLLVAIPYLNTLPNMMFFDDEELIQKNAYIQNFSDLPFYFTQNMIAGAGKVSNMYRPVLLISFAIDFLVWKLNPLGFHLTNIALHLINVALVYLLIKKLFNSPLLAWTSALLFGIHPVQTEAIMYVSGRTDPLSTLWILTCTLTFLRWLKKPDTIMLIISCTLFLLALGSKEISIMVPFIILCASLALTQKFSKKLLVAGLIPFGIILLTYVIFRLTVLNFRNTLNFYDQTTAYSSHLFVRILTFLELIPNYIRVIVFPKTLQIFYSPKIITSALDLNVLPGIVILILLTILTIIAIKKNRRSVWFAIFWIAITMLPVSGIIPINNIMAEHYLYLPSVGIVLGIMLGLRNLYHKFPDFLKTFSLFLMIILLSALSTRTFLRAFDWRTPESFYTFSLKQTPGHIPMMHNLAMYYSDTNRKDEAIKIYQTIIQNKDVYPNTHHNLGNIYLKMGKLQEAEKEFLAALKMDPQFIFSAVALSNLYKKTNQTSKLNELFERYPQIQSYGN